ncbi:alpha/beta hydrolase family esterase [Novipirellula sp. SH528]|uniref:alpha/beta hydrolase family esterase n=1 Tax=Novipirellula sp. SH528 TaxID=3454466 RepID=UPI003F9F2E25
MKHRRYISTVAVVVAIVAATMHFLSTRPPAAKISHQLINVGQFERTFRVTVPKDLVTPAPLVFAFHGIGDSTDSMAAYSQLDLLAAKNGFLLVYPASRNGMWDAINVDPETLDANSDVQFFDALLEHMSSQYQIDRDRVYLMGMSNGGSFVQLLANARSSNIAAVVAHSGPRPRALNDPEHRFPILMIVGSDDFAASSMQTDLDYYREAGHAADLSVIDGLGHAWSTRSNANAWAFLTDHRLSR